MWLVDDRPPLVGVGLPERHLDGVDQAGVVDQQVDAAELLAHPGDGGLDRGAVGDVGGDRERAGAGGLGDLVHRRRQPVGGAGEAGDGHAARGQPLGEVPADPRRGAGDQRDLPRQSSTHAASPRRHGRRSTAASRGRVASSPVSVRSGARRVSA